MKKIDCSRIKSFQLILSLIVFLCASLLIITTTMAFMRQNGKIKMDVTESQKIRMQPPSQNKFRVSEQAHAMLYS